MTELPWGEMVCGVIVGLVFARTQHLFKVIHQRGHKSRCAWCDGHLVDLRDPGAQESMKQHVVTCAARIEVRP